MKQQAARVSRAENTNDRRTLDAATIIIEPEWSGTEQRPVGYRFGATTGGVEFNAEVTYRVREYDGTAGFATMGDQVVESASVVATAQVSELTTAIIQKIMKADIEELADGRKRLKPRRNIKLSDYISSVGIVSWLPNNDWTMIEMKNVLITSPFILATEDNGDMTMEVTMTAHIDPADLATLDGFDDLPYDIITSDSMNPVEGELQAVIDSAGGN